MLQSMRTYIYERRKGLAKSAAFVGGVYLVQRYVTDRLEELKVKLDQEKLAREAYSIPSRLSFQCVIKRMTL